MGVIPYRLVDADNAATVYDYDSTAAGNDRYRHVANFLTSMRVEDGWRALRVINASVADPDADRAFVAEFDVAAVQRQIKTYLEANHDSPDRAVKKAAFDELHKAQGMVTDLVERIDAAIRGYEETRE